MHEKICVLIVDDKLNARATIRGCLTGLNCNFDEARNGDEALELIRMHSFDVIFLDMKLPGISGLEIYKRAKEITSNLGPVIILTGYPEMETAIEAAEMGIFQYLTKTPLDRNKVRGAFIKAVALKTGR